MARNKVSKASFIIASIFSFIIGLLSGLYLHHINNLPISDKIVSGELKIHFLELGNKYTGDSILIQVGEYDILVDAGSRSNSVNTIKQYIDSNIQDDTLEYVIATHADRDHIAAFAGNGETSLFSHYKTGTIIQFPKTDSTTVTYQNYLTMVEKEKQEGAKVYTALECYNNQDGCSRIINLGFGVELEILYNYYYEHTSADENNYSVCFIINQGDNHFLFTGDLEAEGEEKLIEYNTLPEVTLFKAGHHGSKTSSTEALLNIIKPEIIVFTCVAGSYEYTQNKNNTFPTISVLERISHYTDKVYVTSEAISECSNRECSDTGYKSLNGNIIILSSSDGVNVTGSNHDKTLKETDWFKTNRNTIDAWN